MDKLGRIALLNDIYGNLLTDKQKTLLDLFYNEDLSLGEIAEINQISRQAVFDNIKRSEKALEHYEENLGMLKLILNKKLITDKLKTAYQNKNWKEIENIINILQAE